MEKAVIFVAFEIIICLKNLDGAVQLLCDVDQLHSVILNLVVPNNTKYYFYVAFLLYHKKGKIEFNNDKRGCNEARSYRFREDGQRNRTAVN